MKGAATVAPTDPRREPLHWPSPSTASDADCPGWPHTPADHRLSIFSGLAWHRARRWRAALPTQAGHSATGAPIPCCPKGPIDGWMGRS